MFLRFCAKLNCTKADRDDEQPPPRTQSRVINKVDSDVCSTRGARADDPQNESLRETVSPQRENLWEVAGERLDEECREALGLKTASPVANAIEDVIKITEKKYREYKEGGLKIRKRDGGQINFRDSAKNIILYALQAQDLIKTLVAFDPTGHASSAWSVVSIGLTIIKNEIERRDDVFEAAEYLSRILSYYAIVDNHYRERKVASDRGLEDVLVEVYMAVLQYAAEVKKAQNESDTARVLKSITALVQQPLKDLKETVEKKEQAVQKWKDLTADLDHSKQAEHMLDGIDDAVERLKNIQSYNRGLQDREILDWLSMASYSDAQNNNEKHRAPDTGNWFLDLPEYKEWKTTPGKICWLYGAVGCGKSVLCSTVIQDIQEFCMSDPSRSFAYWYFQFSNDETQKVCNMIRSILRQFTPRTLPASMIKLWEEHRHRGSMPQQQKLAEILDIVLETSQSEFFLILDALDECPAKNDERGSLLQFLEELLGKHRARIHILATSRPEPDIRARLEQYQLVNLETRLGEDVETFVRDQVAHGRLCEWNESVKKLTLEKLLDIPERRFRWADLQIKRLEMSKTEAAFYKALDSIPVTLEDTYKDTLERLSPDDREAARTILIWLSFSAVPLDLKTVAAVVSFRFPEDVMTTCNTSLVTVNLSDDTVILAHFSVKEFLVRNEPEGQWYQFSALFAHAAIANKTIDCLLETTEILTKTTAVQKPLLIYAAKYWDRHLADLRDLHANCTGFHGKVDRLFTEHDVYFNWVRLVDFNWDYVWDQTFEELEPPLYIASEKGLKPVEALLAKGANPMGSQLDISNNALVAAARRGHLEVLELLLNRIDEIPRGVTRHLLEWIKTAEADREKLAVILDLLWDKGALYGQSRASHRIMDERLLESAAGNIRSAHILIDVLLDRKEKMGVKVTEKLLTDVLLNGYCGNEIVHLVLKICDADIKLTPSLMKALLSAPHTDAAMAVLKRRVNDIMLDEGCIGAFAQGKKEAMELLLQERGQDIQVTQSVLITAARFTHDPQTVRLLLNRREPGTEINKGVLLAAAKNTSKGTDIMNMLLDECGQDTIIDEEVIQEIAYNEYGSLGMMKLLLCRQQAGFMVSEQTLSNAAKCQDREMLELLVNNAGGSELPITGKTLRSVADNYVHGKALIEYLFDLRGHSLPVSEDVLVSVADVDKTSTVDCMLAFILERWPEIPASDQLLEAACRHPSAMGLLLDRRCDCLPIQTMIHKIATDRYNGGKVLEMLLDRRLVEVDEWLVETVAGNSYTLQVIYNRNPDFLVTPKIFVNAARDVDAMRILLDRQKNQVLSTEEVIKASLIGRGSANHRGSLDICHSEPPIEFSRVAFETTRELNLSAVWEAIWQDPEISPSALARAAGTLVQYFSIDVSETMLERLTSEGFEEFFLWSDYSVPGISGWFDDFIRLCMQHRIPLPTTETAFELIVERSTLNTIDIFLEDHPDIPITERHIQAAMRNQTEYMDKDALLSLLRSKSSLS
ncbi:hypothetical protein BO94DRAFT_574028 [Aspergillus sclerotioniger CBS 115572]|uniref:Nephrocystin 3-like N-terminal domain-containing protein n=1 Tax=Aspergillus sclerotioniger CBS 115572 TaxID=1450535 RepID=A0A317X3T9_9EURO|nr:hypothetical protein BO94DRAFT_574028 [Aspergillus sclerotioniger CBS 115572]PWY91628.1 hypothetical protein BO94DRAFT_574028 [Aspergillus sclerotioniger CBS 115572]